jgi:hypothetical protein
MDIKLTRLISLRAFLQARMNFGWSSVGTRLFHAIVHRSTRNVHGQLFDLFRQDLLGALGRRDVAPFFDATLELDGPRCVGPTAQILDSVHRRILAVIGLFVLLQFSRQAFQGHAGRLCRLLIRPGRSRLLESGSLLLPLSRLLLLLLQLLLLIVLYLLLLASLVFLGSPSQDMLPDPFSYIPSFRCDRPGLIFAQGHVKVDHILVQSRRVEMRGHRPDILKPRIRITRVRVGAGVGVRVRVGVLVSRLVRISLGLTCGSRIRRGSRDRSRSRSSRSSLLIRVRSRGASGGLSRGRCTLLR